MIYDVISPVKRIVVGMSGGVDSSVAAWLLKQQGYDVIGLFMKNWEDDDNDAYCSSRQDWLDAVSVADLIGIDIDAVNFAQDYKTRVFSEFLQEYQAGRTPNPDVLCNPEIKFKAFLDHAHTLGAQGIATGHYARLHHVNGQVQLLKARDKGKDQSYFLYRLNQTQLRQTLFPLGELTKSEVRKIADRLKLPNARKKDSTGICFIGERPFRAFLNRYLAIEPGPIQTEEGKIVGQHMGLSFYTLGQRKGIGIGGMKEGSAPWYVARKDRDKNMLTIVQGHDHPRLLSSHLKASRASWVAGVPPIPVHTPPYFSAKIRYRQMDASCTLSSVQIKELCFSLHFDKPQWAVAPGQSVVLYLGENCLGGGMID